HVYLTTGDAAHAVAFSYTYGQGHVLYAAIPLDLHLNSSNAFKRILAPNLIAQGVALINAAPVAQPGSGSTDEDGSVSGNLHGSDADGDALTYSILTGPSHGTLTLSNPATGAFTYVPNADFHGTDTFTFGVSDGEFQSGPATVTLNVRS